MKRFTEYLSGSAAVLFQVALTGWMFALSEINFDFVSMELNYLLLSAVMLGAYYLNSIVMRRGLSVPLFALLQVFILAAAVFAFVKSARTEPYELRTIIINCIVYCLGFAVVVFLSWNPTNQNGILLRFDALAMMIVIMLVLDHVLYMPGARQCLNMCFISLIITILSAVSLRSGALLGRGSAVEGNPALGRIMLIVVAAAMGVLALLVIIFAAGEVKSFSEFLLKIINICISAVKTVLLWIYSLLERFLLWLSQFMKDTPMESIGAETVGGMPDAPMEETELSLPRWLYAIPAAIVLAVFAYIVFRLRKMKAVTLRTRSHVITKVRRESGLMEALRALWARMKGEMLFRFNCLRYRRSSAGLLVWCQKKCPKELSRRTGESGESFLLRIGKSLGEEGESHLASLAELVQRSFYSPKPEKVPKELYKAIKKLRFKTSA